MPVGTLFLIVDEEKPIGGKRTGKNAPAPTDGPTDSWATRLVLPGPRLIARARQRFAGDPRFVFPRRVSTLSSVTQAAGLECGDTGDSEVYQMVSHAQFDRMRRQGAFALYWSEGGANYALPSSVRAELAAGRSVVAVVARKVLPAALKAFDRVTVIDLAEAATSWPWRESDAEIAAAPGDVPLYGNPGDSIITAAIGLPLAQNPAKRRLPV